MILQVTESNLGRLFEVMSLVDGPFSGREEEIKSKLRKFVNRDDCRAFIFVENGVALGYLGCKLHEESRSDDLNLQIGSLGHIAKIGVREDARGRGIGKQLLETGEQWIKSRGMPGAWLDYIANETRERLYRDYKIILEYTETGKVKKRRVVVKRW